MSALEALAVLDSEGGFLQFDESEARGNGNSVAGSYFKKRRLKLRKVRAAVAELVAADRELDAAQDALCEAKREKGQWRVNPLRHDDPNVLRVRAAKARRAEALNAIEGISA
ncbi:MAG TPA: hypothetical protein VFE72_04005 [Lysobacter sp.]|nr:hypothetical protein [Lysobacter sp.]